MTKHKPIPKFKSEKQERAFWEAKDRNSTDYLDWSRAEPAVFSQLKPTTTAISLRLPESLLASVKSIANGMDIPYQSLMKMWLTEKAAEKTQPPSAR